MEIEVEAEHSIPDRQLLCRALKDYDYESRATAMHQRRRVNAVCLLSDAARGSPGSRRECKGVSGSRPGGAKVAGEVDAERVAEVGYRVGRRWQVGRWTGRVELC
jgi:hypothetical protein